MLDPGTKRGKQVTRDQFIALASNKVPGSDQTLTARNKDKRTSGYDFCFSVPKNISVYLAETGDQAVERMVEVSFKERWRILNLGWKRGSG
jgi:hypothetical protein